MESSRIILIHKADESKPSKPSKIAIATTHEIINVARVRRPGIERLIETGEFASMPSIPQAVIDNPDRRRIEYPEAFYVIEEADMGRRPKNGERDLDSTAQSILLWIKKFYVETPKPLVRASELSIVVERFTIEE